MLANALLVFAVVLAAAGIQSARREPQPTRDVVHLASGLSASESPPATTTRPPTAAPAPAAEVDSANSADAAPPALVPGGVRIDRLGVSARTVPVGLAPDGTLAVPPPGSTGWYSLGLRPGEAGHAVIAGHVDSHVGPDVFYRLRELRAGDVVVVHDTAGTELKFIVESVEQHAKAVLPATRVWAPTERPMLALITCGGAFDRSRRTYLDNVVVYAALADPA